MHISYIVFIFITDHFVSLSFLEVCVDLSTALSLGNFFILVLQASPLLTVGFACAHEWLKAILVAMAERLIEPYCLSST